MNAGRERRILVGVTIPIATTRRCWHAVAELVLAGPQYRRSGTIRLRIVPGGFATVAEPALQVIGADLVHATGSVPIAGQTARQLATAAGVDVGTAEGVYHDGSGVGPDDVLELNAAVAQRLADAFGIGDAALRAFAPDRTPVLWPEHFDLGISVEAERANYGVSPGDGSSDEPYAYVGPWEPSPGGFWNQPFGAARPLSELSEVDKLVGFFAEGQRLLQASAPGRASGVG
jgi:hypothetical protein